VDVRAKRFQNPQLPQALFVGGNRKTAFDGQLERFSTTKQTFIYEYWTTVKT
jgi:hypothetical protein